ncbi:hypothetical protein H632_c1334p0, partial [Helicosporidium sp. ATCC 50920]
MLIAALLHQMVSTALYRKMDILGGEF